MPRALHTVAMKSPGAIGLFSTVPPLPPVSPIARPCFRPPPASTVVHARLKWLDPLAGFRPNSPIAITRVESSRPRAFRSLGERAVATGVVAARQRPAVEDRQVHLAAYPA